MWMFRISRTKYQKKTNTENALEKMDNDTFPLVKLNGSRDRADEYKYLEWYAKWIVEVLNIFCHHNMMRPVAHTKFGRIMEMRVKPKGLQWLLLHSSSKWNSGGELWLQRANILLGPIACSVRIFDIFGRISMMACVKHFVCTQTHKYTFAIWRCLKKRSQWPKPLLYLPLRIEYIYMFDFFHIWYIVSIRRHNFIFMLLINSNIQLVN